MTLLSTAEFRALHPSGLGDTALQMLLDAAEAEIDAAYGPVGSTEELFRGGFNRLVVLARPAASITSITETRGTTVTTLSADDYLVHPDGFVIERLSGGTNSRWSWSGRITVTYTAVDDEDQRKVVQADLVQLMQSYAPGITSETIGAWTQQLAANSVWNASEEREAILARLSPGPSLVIVGGR